LVFFGTEVALVVSVFASFNLLYNEVNRAETQGLVPKSSVSQFFYLGGAFVGSGEASNEVSDLRHSSGQEGLRKQPVSCPVCRSRASSERKTASVT
jgi:hypothetical protein